MFSIRKFLKRHPCALGVIILFIMGLTSYESISTSFGYENASREQLGSTYNEYMLFMLIPVMCLAAIPFLWGMWVTERKYRKRDYKSIRFIGDEIIDELERTEESVTFTD